MITKTRRTGRRLALGALAASCLIVSACAGNHRDQPYEEAQEPSQFFADNRATRPFVENTVAQGAGRNEEDLYEGTQNGRVVNAFPFPVTRRVLEQGQQQYNAHCLPCHGYAGYGDGMIVRRGYSRPPSYHIDRLRQETLGHYYNVIANGYGAMPAYADQVYPRDRWAIIAYIRALQLSQNANVDELPADVRERLNNPPAAETEGGEGTEEEE